MNHGSLGTKMMYSSSSSGGDNFHSESDDVETVTNGNFPSMPRNLLPKDYVIIQFEYKKN